MKLHGFAISNYYNTAKFALLEKGITFEEVDAHPSQEEAFLSKSPMGKIPVLEVDGIFISESQAILQYIERVKPEPALYPSDAVQAARAQQIHQFLSLYVDGEARKLLGAAFFGRETTEEAKEDAYKGAVKALTALNRITRFSPFIAGDTFTHADIIAATTLPLPTMIFTKLGMADPSEHLEGVTEYMALLQQRPAFQKVVADQQAAMVAWQASKK